MTLNKYISIIMVLILTSCNFSECEKLEFSKEEESWSNQFIDGDLSIYNSNLGSIDTLECSVIKDGYKKCNKLERSKYKQREVYISFHLKKNGNIFFNDVVFSADKFYKNKPARICLYVFNKRWCGNIKNELDGQIKSNDIEVKSNSPSSREIRSFTWSRKKGLTTYILETGEEFILVSNP